jgi:hypothetical protein
MRKSEVSGRGRRGQDRWLKPQESSIPPKNSSFSSAFKALWALAGGIDEAGAINDCPPEIRSGAILDDDRDF